MIYNIISGPLVRDFNGTVMYLETLSAFMRYPN